MGYEPSIRRRVPPWQRMLLSLASPGPRLDLMADGEKAFRHASPTALPLALAQPLGALLVSLRSLLRSNNMPPSSPNLLFALVSYLLRLTDSPTGEAALREDAFRFLADRAWLLAKRLTRRSPRRTPAPRFPVSLSPCVLLPSPVLANRVQALSHINACIHSPHRAPLGPPCNSHAATRA